METMQEALRVYRRWGWIILSISFTVCRMTGIYAPSAESMMIFAVVAAALHSFGGWAKLTAVTKLRIYSSSLSSSS